MSLETYKDIKGYEDLYQVSNIGNVKSVFRYNQILKPQLDSDGYLYVGLYINGKRKYKDVHRLVAENFISNPENKPEVNHKDGNKLNNNDWNLEWNTDKENTNHALYVLNNKPNHRKKVICTNTGTIYDSIQQAKTLANIKYNILHLSKMLRGKVKNKTTLRLL